MPYGISLCVTVAYQKLPTVSWYATSHLDLPHYHPLTAVLYKMWDTLHQCISTCNNQIHQPACINIGAICCITHSYHGKTIIDLHEVIVFCAYTAREIHNISNINSSKMGHDNKRCLYHPNSALQSSILPNITLLHSHTTRKKLTSFI